MLIPIVRELVRTGPLQGSKLYMPISFASVLGGTCTLIGTSVNIIIGGMILDTIAQNAPGTPPMRALEIFDPAWVAVPAAVLGIALMILGSRFLFPAREEEETSGETRLYRAEFLAGKLPVFAKGVYMEQIPNNGSREWKDLNARAQEGGVHLGGRPL